MVLPFLLDHLVIGRLLQLTRNEPRVYTTSEGMLDSTGWIDALMEAGGFGVRGLRDESFKSKAGVAVIGGAVGKSTDMSCVRMDCGASSEFVKRSRSRDNVWTMFDERRSIRDSFGDSCE